MSTKAFSYLRVSGLGQVNGDGFTRQREAILKYASEHDVIIEREFEERGVCGAKDGYDRPAWNDLMAEIKSNGVRLVLVERADRLARDLMVSEVILADLRKIGVRLIAAECGTDLTVENGDPTKKLIRQVLAAIAEYDKCLIVQKTRAARLRIRKEKGRCEGAKPYGFRDGERSVITRIQELRGQNLTIAQISDQLNFEGVQPRKAGTRWHPTMVSRILNRDIGFETTSVDGKFK